MSDALPVAEAAAEAASFEPEPFVSDYVPGTVGHAVLAVGHDHNGAEAVAVWQVSPTGQPTGAWIVATDAATDALTGAADAEAVREKARRLLRIVERRSVVGWSSEDVTYVLGRLADTATTDLAPGWAETAVYLPAALAEIAGYRGRYTEAVTEYQKVSKSKVAPLAWQHDVPAGVSSLKELADAAGLTSVSTTSEVAAEALLTARTLAWTVGLWQETEQVRLRRRYLVERFGSASVLPEHWLGRLRAANARGIERARRARLTGVG
jgi:Family of unknown function (DUF6218)